MTREFERSTRLGEQMRRLLADLIRRELDDPRLGLSEHHRTSASPATSRTRRSISVCSAGTKTWVRRRSSLTRAAGRLRGELARTMTARTVPALEFLYDASLAEGARMDELIADGARATTSRGRDGGGGEELSAAIRISRQAVGRAWRRDVDGILLLDKPTGWTSNFALQRVKRLFRARKAGHTGSLDPLASGLLPLCLGEATKVSAFLLDADKRYPLRVVSASRRIQPMPTGRSSRRPRFLRRIATDFSVCSDRARTARSTRCRRCIRRSSTTAGASTSWRAPASRWSAQRSGSASTSLDLRELAATIPSTLEVRCSKGHVCPHPGRGTSVSGWGAAHTSPPCVVWGVGPSTVEADMLTVVELETLAQADREWRARRAPPAAGQRSRTVALTARRG